MAFKDFSKNNFEITAFGNAQISTSVKKYGDGSALFDGNGDYITVEDPNAFNFGSQDFTVECWIKPDTNPSPQFVVGAFITTASPTDKEGIFLGITPSRELYWLYSSGGSWIGPTSNPITETIISDSTWSHIAWVRSGNNTYLYVNGQQIASGNMTGTLTNTNNALLVGGRTDSTQYYAGYIDDLRITKGIARYTSNFTPPQQQLPTTTDANYPNVVLLLPMNLGPFIDSSTNNFELTAVGNTDLSKSIVKYGTAAVYFDGSGDYLELAATDAFNFYNTNFTIEGWIYNATNQTGGAVISTRLGGVYSPWELQIGYPNVNRISLLIQSGGSSWYNNAFYGTTVLPINQWVHIAWVCQNNNHTVYVNGVADSSLTNLNAPILQSFAQPSNVYIGKGGDGDFNGYIDELRITKGIARYTANFTPPQQQLPDPSDPYQDNVSLLLHMDQNQFVDASLNNFTITPFGNARSSTQVVKYGDTAAYFDGNGDYIEVVSNDAFNFGTGDFTIEAWIYLNSTLSDYFISSANGSGGLFFGFRDNTDIGWGRAGVAWDYSTPSGITTGQWYHVAISRNGTDMRLFVNGNQVGTTQSNSTSYNLGTGNLGIGAQANNYFLDGYIDDLRITKGVARYTTTFTPPSAQLPTFTDPDFANVSLLLQTNRPFTDSSSNNFTLSAFGDAQISTSIKKLGSGSGYFDGTGDYLELPLNSAFDFGSGDFTIECWFYTTKVGFQTLVARWSGGNNAFFLGTDTSAPNIQLYINGFLACIGGAPQLNQWNHIAAIRNSADIKLFLNGIQVGNTFNIGNTPINTTTNKLRIGFDNGGNPYFQGYIDELRITKGVARYTSNFVPHTAPFVNPIILIPSGYLAFWKLADLTDSSPNGNNLVNTGNVQFVAGKIGDCAQFNGNNKLSITSFSPTFNAGQDFSISFWANPTSNVLGTIIGGTNNQAFNIHNDNSGTLNFNNGLSADCNVPNAFTVGTWKHYVCIKAGGKTKVYIDGIIVYNQNSNVSYNASTTSIAIGRFPDNSLPYQGYIDAVGVWQRELTQSEIDILYNNGNGREP